MGYPKADTHVITSIERGAHIEVGNAKRGKPGVAARQDTVDKDLDEFQVDSGCTNITRIENAIATNGNMISIGVSFIGLDLTEYFGVGYLFYTFSRNVF